MTIKCKGLVKCSFFCLIILSAHTSWCLIEEEQEGIFQNRDNRTKNSLGKNCWEMKCSENQLCNIFENMCECRFGFVNRSNICVPCAEENEECLSSDDCCQGLLCATGVCGKATYNEEFITLTKICLGITVTSIIIALLASLLKCLMRFENFRMLLPCRISGGTNSTITQGRDISEIQPPPNRLQEEKPPSYEECMLPGRQNSLEDPPPPYVICSSNFTTNKQNYFVSKTAAAQSS